MVTVTLYVPAVLTVRDCAVEPSDQRYDDMAAGADRVTLPPVQKLVGPLEEMEAAGGAATATVVGAEDAGQPLLSVTVTE